MLASTRRAIALVVFGLVLAALAPRAARCEDPPLRKTLEDKHAEGSDLWIYNDIARAIEEGKRENKPIFVTFRCVPCKDCAAFDAEVAQGSDVIETFAREHFVSVRQVEMKGVDLSLFQFDYDLNWAAMFINADGTVYARYGTQSAAGADAYNSIEGLHATMKRVLELHAKYPANKAELAGKRGAAKPYRTPIEMPGLENKERLLGATTRRNCIHCHNIHDAENLHAQATGAFTQDMLWRYPLPENVGLKIARADGRTIEGVVVGSPAGRAKLAPGDELTHVEGQAIASIADIQWALDDLPNTKTEVRVRTAKGGEKTLSLPAGWKRSDFSWRGSMHSVQPRLRVWTPALEAEDKKKRGLGEERNALLVRWINRDKPGGRAAFDAGLREGDVIVAVDGKEVMLSPQHLNMHVKLHYKVGEELPLTVLRDGKELALKVKLVE